MQKYCETHSACTIKTYCYNIGPITVLWENLSDRITPPGPCCLLFLLLLDFENHHYLQLMCIVIAKVLLDAKIFESLWIGRSQDGHSNSWNSGCPQIVTPAFNWSPGFPNMAALSALPPPHFFPNMVASTSDLSNCQALVVWPKLSMVNMSLWDHANWFH